MKGLCPSDDGCPIAFDFEPQGKQPVLMMSPSLGTSMALFDGQVKLFRSWYSVLRYDPRGHGRSGAPAGDYTMDRLGRDAVRLLDYLDISKAHFMGVSLGGMTGQWLGMNAPDRVGRLVLANTSAYMGPPAAWSDRMALVREKGMSAIADAVVDRWFTPEYRRQNFQEVADVRAVLQATHPVGYTGCCAAIRDMDFRGKVASIPSPALIIGGNADPATPIDHSDFLAENITNSRLEILDAAHLSNLEQPQAFNSAVARFLEDL